MGLKSEQNLNALVSSKKTFIKNFHQPVNALKVILNPKTDHFLLNQQDKNPRNL